MSRHPLLRTAPTARTARAAAAARSGALRALTAAALAAGAALLSAQTAHAAAPETTTTPTVVNPGFEANGTGTAAPTGWTASGTTPASYTEAGGHSGSYRLSHWSSSAYSVDTYQTVTNITDGDYTLGVWVRSDDTGGANYISLSGCGSSTKTTYVPVDSDGNWIQIVDYIDVTNNQCTINFVSDSAAGAWTNYDDVTFTAGSAPVAVRGADVSSLYRGEQDGGVYYTSSGTEENALQIMSAAGLNYVRLRVFVNPEDGFNDEAQLLGGAKQAYSTYHLPIYLDLEYSDTWAAPGQQAVPAAWSSDSFAQLESQTYTYADQIVGALVAQGTAPGMVQVGNEINAGMLLPDGSTANWTQLGDLLKEGVAGVRAADSGAKVVLHLAGSDDLATLESWYSDAIAQGVSFDVIGISYYDYWDGRLDVLQTDLDGLAAEYGKPVMVAETAYPWTLDNATGVNTVTSSNTTLDPGYPATPAGQQANFRDVLSIVQAVPHGLGLGAFYWEPTWTVVAGNGWSTTDITTQTGWENQAMFNLSDAALPAIGDYAAR
jgi:arabinogalactan endo-1,4-beta-galactosidase